MYIQELLIAWGRGRAIDDAPNGYPRQSAFARMAGMGNVEQARLPDEEQLRVDGAVSDMKEKKPDHYAVICNAYIRGLPDSVSALRLRPKRSRSWVRNIRENAEHYLEAKLEP